MRVRIAHIQLQSLLVLMNRQNEGFLLPVHSPFANVHSCIRFGSCWIVFESEIEFRLRPVQIPTLQKRRSQTHVSILKRGGEFGGRPKPPVRTHVKVYESEHMPV